MGQRDLSIAELAALQAITTELPKISSWLDSINANLGEMVGHLEAFTEVEETRTIIDSELPEPKEGTGDNTAPGQ